MPDDRPQDVGHLRAGLADDRSDIARARLAAIVDSSDDAIVGKTLEGVITSWNRAAERIFGWTAAEAVGRHITFIIPPERHAEEEQVLARLCRGETVDHFESIRVTKDGRRLTISLTVSPIKDGNGRIVGASKVARDVSERRHLEDERTRLLAREQQARMEAEALNRAKDEFLATASHELRTPLNTIFGWARMLQSGEMDEAARRRAINAIVRAASAQAKLVEDLIDLSRVATGRMRLDFVSVDLKTLINAALEAVRPAAMAKQIALGVTLDPAVTAIAGAPDRLQQVVWNLVMNAVKFTPRGGQVQVTLRQSVGDVEIVVTDTGEGIAPEVLPYVFEAFRQEDSSCTRAHSGLGLGLALVRHLVELHGGRVRAQSAGKGLGTTLTVTLPTLPPGSERSDVQPPVPTTKVDAPSLRGVRVLVENDNADALELSAIVLRTEGADVKTASSAVRASELVASWQPDVLVSELVTPGRDDFVLVRSLQRAEPEQAPGPDTRFDFYLTKPIDPVRLSRAVADVVRRARSGQAADDSVSGPPPSLPPGTGLPDRSASAGGP